MVGELLLQDLVHRVATVAASAVAENSSGIGRGSKHIFLVLQPVNRRLEQVQQCRHQGNDGASGVYNLRCSHAASHALKWHVARANRAAAASVHRCKCRQYQQQGQIRCSARAGRQRRAAAPTAGVAFLSEWRSLQPSPPSRLRLLCTLSSSLSPVFLARPCTACSFSGHGFSEGSQKKS